MLLSDIWMEVIERMFALQDVCQLGTARLLCKPLAFNWSVLPRIVGRTPSMKRATWDPRLRGRGCAWSQLTF